MKAARERTKKNVPPQDPAARILLVDADPYLSFIIRSGFPELEVLEAQSTSPAELPDEPTDVAVIDLSVPTSGRAITQLSRSKKLGVISRGEYLPGPIPPGLDQILVKPFSPSELYASISQLAGWESDQQSYSKELDDRVRWGLGIARLAAVALAAVLEVATTSVAPGRSVGLALAFLYSTLRLRFGRPPLIVAWLDVLIALIVPVSETALVGNYLAFRAVIALGAGITLGLRTGTAASFVIGLVSTRNGFADVVSGEIPIIQFLSAILFLPIIAVAGAYGYSLRRAQTLETSPALVETNRILKSLLSLAKSMPQGFDFPRVVEAVMEEVKKQTRSPSSLLILGEPGYPILAGSYGIPSTELSAIREGITQLQPFLKRRRISISLDQLPDSFKKAMGGNDWVVLPLRLERGHMGYLAVAQAKSQSPEQLFDSLETTVTDLTLALDNTWLFDRIREVSADQERSRIAGELHDGVAQSLAHMRMELELLERSTESPDRVSEELTNVRRVAERALDDVRRTIGGMRLTVAREGLIGALREYFSEMRITGTPELIFDVGEVKKLTREREAETFRIVQEAVSNAIRHSRGWRVKVSVDMEDSFLAITVEDDGIGFDPASAGDGFGLELMRERAARIGARLEINAEQRRGTTLKLLVPVE